MLPTPVFLGFPCGSTGKESACNAGDLGSIAGLGRSPGEGKGYPLRYSGLEYSMGCKAHGVAKSQTRLSSFHFHFTFLLTQTVKNLPAMQETWVRSLGLKDRSLEKGTAPSPVLLPGESHGQRSREGYWPRGRQESHGTEPLTLSLEPWH